jgi:hypothetical protein
VDARETRVDFVIKLFIPLQKTLKSFSRFSYWNKERTAEEPLINPRKRQVILPLLQNIQAFSETNTDSHTKHLELKAGHLSISHVEVKNEWSSTSILSYV